MRQSLALLFVAGIAMLATLAVSVAVRPAQANSSYPWLAPSSLSEPLTERIAPPRGFTRVPVANGSFAAWLRSLPMRPAGTPVRLHTGGLKARQDVHVAVIDIDTGKRDLQQCADAVMRLRAEWLRSTGRAREIAFNDTGGAEPMSYARWSKGERPRVVGRRLAWSRRASRDESYAGFRRYLDTVFTYAGTYSLERELKRVGRDEMRIGDVFIKGGFPGHAVLVADIVENAATGERRFLLIQSYMPAQDMHVLKNPGAADDSPWYPAAFNRPLITPEWVFPAGSLKGWR